MLHGLPIIIAMGWEFDNKDLSKLGKKQTIKNSTVIDKDWLQILQQSATVPGVINGHDTSLYNKTRPSQHMTKLTSWSTNTKTGNTENSITPGQ